MRPGASLRSFHINILYLHPKMCRTFIICPPTMCKLSHIFQVSQSLRGNFKSIILFDPFSNPGKSENRDEESKSTEEETEAFCSYLTHGKIPDVRVVWLQLQHSLRFTEPLSGKRLVKIKWGHGYEECWGFTDGRCNYHKDKVTCVALECKLAGGEDWSKAFLPPSGHLVKQTVCLYQSLLIDGLSLAQKII